MPRQNRVDPFGRLIATPQRGSLMGNRGCLHDDAGTVRKAFARKAWVTCRLEWKDIRRPVFTPGLYSELFFFDEATALAAGHRPCNHCRKEDYKTFNEAFSRAFSQGRKIMADAMDIQVHSERIGSGHIKRTYTAELSSLPDGAMVLWAEEPDTPQLLWKGNLFRWSFDGYSDAVSAKEVAVVEVLTPASICAVLIAGYPVKVNLGGIRRG